jgi:hypothetical protein
MDLTLEVHEPPRVIASGTGPSTSVDVDVVEVGESAYPHRKWTSPSPGPQDPQELVNTQELSREMVQSQRVGHWQMWRWRRQTLRRKTVSGCGRICISISN